MRGKRAKQYRKLMHQYQHTFNFREPYQVLLDAEILQDASRYTMDLVGGLKRTLQGEVKPMITQCCMRHLYNAKPKNEELIMQAKRYERRRCNHQDLEQPMSAMDCLSEVVDPKDSGTNRHRYVVATQDKEVRAKMRGKLGVPLIYINRSVMILEPMAAESEDVREREERAKFRSGLMARTTQSAGVKRPRDDAEQESGGASETRNGDNVVTQPKKRKIRGPKGPNPLSVKKSQKQKSAPDTSRVISRKEESGKISSPGADVGGDAELKKKRRRKHKHGEKADTMDTTGEAVET